MSETLRSQSSVVAWTDLYTTVMPEMSWNDFAAEQTLCIPVRTSSSSFFSVVAAPFRAIVSLHHAPATFLRVPPSPPGRKFVDRKSMRTSSGGMVVVLL